MLFILGYGLPKTRIGFLYGKNMLDGLEETVCMIAQSKSLQLAVA